MSGEIAPTAVGTIRVIVLTLALLQPTAAGAVDLTRDQLHRGAAAIRATGYPCISIVKVERRGKAYRSLALGECLSGDTMALEPCGVGRD